MDYWGDVNNLIESLNQISMPAVQKAAEQAGFPENQWRGWLLPAFILAPEPIQPAHLRIRSPYTNPSRFNELLASHSQRGDLKETEKGYTLSRSAYKSAEQMMAAGRAALITQYPESDPVFFRLLTQLQKVHKACITAAEPQSKWCLLHNRDRISLESQPVIIQLDQLCSDLSAWRDDCHLGAWQPYHYFQGYIWEMFGIIWQSGLHTLAEISQALGDRRGYTPNDYRIAADELILRGWVFEESNHFYLTPSGIRIRQLAEDYTNELFLAPFFALSADELAGLDRLLQECLLSIRKPSS